MSQLEPLRIAIVGHSNVGKTSLVAALTRDASLDIAEEAGTTRAHYERLFRIAGEAVLAFVDTPGFETAGRINRLLEERAGAGVDAPDGRAQLAAFLADATSDAEFTTEKEALRGVLEADVLAYVADVTSEPSGQQRQEIRLLRRAGVPIVAVLNVLSDADSRAEWSELLRRENVDTIVPLDAWSFPADQERHFYRALAVLRPEREGAFQRIVSLREALAESHRTKSALIIASMLVDSLSFRLDTEHASKDDAMKERKAANRRFKELLAERERAAFEEIARTYGFDSVQVEGDGLKVDSWSGDWTGDLFDPEALKRYGVSAGTLGVAGALLGSVVDGVGGMGFGTVLGGGAGVAAGLLVGRRVSTTVDSAGKLTVGPVDAVQFPSLLLNRAADCWYHFEARSHARRDQVRVSVGEGERLGARGVAKLGRLANRCRRNADWSRIERNSPPPAERDRTVDELADLVETLLVPASEAEQS